MIIQCPFTVSRNAKVLTSIMLSDYAYLCYWTDLEFGWRFQDFFCFSNRVDSVHVWQCRPRMTFVSRLWKFAPSKSVLKHLTIQNDHSRVTYRVLLYIILIKLQSKMIISSLGEWFSWWSYLWSVSWDWSTPAVWRVSKFRTLELVSSESTKPLLKPIISPFNISFYQIVKNTQFHHFSGRFVRLSYWSDCYRTVRTSLTSLAWTTLTQSLLNVIFRMLTLQKMELISKNGTRYCDLSK